MTDEYRPGDGKKVSLIGVPLGFGAGKSGSELGADAMRLADLRGARLIDRIRELGYAVDDRGNVNITKPDLREDDGSNPKYLKEMTASSERMIEGIGGIFADGAMPIILGGDHSIAIGTFSAVSANFHRQGKEIGLIWFDAHADINTPETTISRNLHGMPLAVILGEGSEQLVNLAGFAPKLDRKYFAHIGARDLDAGERSRINSFGIRDQFFTMSDVDRYGMYECVRRAIDIAGQAPGGYAVTFDVDFLDPVFAPGSGTLVRGGATYREAHLALETIAKDGRMCSFEIVEVNPLLDQSNITVELACELVLSALGKTIL